MLNAPTAGNLGVAYLRVSKGGQDPENQRADIERIARARGLLAAGFEYFVETVSGASPKRPAFDAMMNAARARLFNVLIVWALDRFGRSMASNIRDVFELDHLGVQVISVSEPWLDTKASGPVRDLLVAIFSWVAEQERRRLGERTRAGLELARARGKRLGRTQRCVSPAELARAHALKAAGVPIRVIAQRVRVPRATLHAVLKRTTAPEVAKPRAATPARGASGKRTIGGR